MSQRKQREYETQHHPLTNGSTVSISRDTAHKYWIGSHGAGDNEKVRSVTTIAGWVDGDLFGAGMGWALQQARLNGGDLGAPARSSTAARQEGDRLHQAIDQYIKHGVVDEDDQLFVAWLNAVGLNHDWAVSEQFVYHPKLRYGGTIDAVSADNPGDIVTLWDWKSKASNSYYSQKEKNGFGGYLKEYAQLAAYADALRALGSLYAPTKGCIAYIMRDGSGVDVVEVDLKYGSKLFRASRQLFRLTTGGA